MKRVTLLLSLALLAAACGGSGPRGGVSSVPGHGAITITIEPNPIRATRVSGNTYDFPFEVVIRETGGRPVEISRVTADVLFAGGLRLANESYDAARIRQLGFNTTVPPNGELRYRFSQRREVPDERLFSGVSAELRVEGRDDTGTATTAGTTVTVTR
jgi:hypothetical protein